MRVLVTGAGGFLGRYLVAAMIPRGFEVFGVVRRETALPDGVVAVRADLETDAALPARVDAIVHAAALARPGMSAGLYTDSNVLITKRIADYARRCGARAVFFVSSTSVYGEPEVDVLEESQSPVDPGTYGLTKLLAERLLQETGSPGCLAVRVPAILGDRARDNWPARTLAAIRAGAPVPIYGADSPYNAAIHAKDIAEFAARWLLEGRFDRHDRVNLAGAPPVAVERAVRAMADAIGRSPEFAPTAQVRRARLVSVEKAEKNYGFAPTPILVSLRDYAREAEWTVST